MQDITGRDLKYQIIYWSKKNTYGMPNTYLTVPIPVSTGREYFSNPFVRKSYAALCTAYSSKQYSIPAVLLKYLPEENKYTEIPTGLKSTYWFITEQREISESYQNTYRGTQAIIPTGGCQYRILRWAVLFFQSLPATRPLYFRFF
jgi:hypothetical protein